MKSFVKKRRWRKAFWSAFLPICIASISIITVILCLWASLRSPVYSSNYLLMNVASGEIIDSHEENERIYPASLTKIMTALLAIEHTDDFSVVITVPEDIFDKIYKTGASVAGFEPGELATLEELLYGIMLPSGAECCLAYAEWTAGSEADFVLLMNQRARELGMGDTNFANCTGLHSADHYTTAYDLAILLRYALQNETFRRVFTTEDFMVTPSAIHPYGFNLHSTLSTAMAQCEEPVPTGISVLGGKTGYTSAAGLCLASLAEVQGEEYVLITVGAEGSLDSPPYHVLDATTLYAQILDSYAKK